MFKRTNKTPTTHVGTPQVHTYQRTLEDLWEDATALGRVHVFHSSMSDRYVATITLRSLKDTEVSATGRGKGLRECLTEAVQNAEILMAAFK